MIVRAATLADVVTLHALVEAGYRGDTARRGWSHEADLLGGQRTDAAALTASIGDAREQVLLAELDGALVGCVQISDRGHGLAYLGLLTVDPDRQAQGLGRALIEIAERTAVEMFGAATMEMTVIRQRPELIAYYARRGYLPTGETRPFPLDDPAFGIPTTRDLSFVVLARSLADATPHPVSRANGDIA